jgi:hypothetical protein
VSVVEQAPVIGAASGGGSGASPGSGPPPGSAPTTGAAIGARVRAAGWPLAIVALVLAAVLLTLLTSGKGNDLPLDPGGVGPSGSRALAQVLDGHGVRVEVERTAAAAANAANADPGATVLVSRTDLLGDPDVQALRGLASPGRQLVLVAPDQRQLDVLAPGLRELDRVSDRVVSRGCDLTEAVTAGRADAGGSTYDIADNPQAIGCYPVRGRPTLVVWPSTGIATVIGQADLLRNDQLAKEGNAALLIGLLGRSDHLIWFAPSGEFLTGEQHSLGSLLPPWVRWAVLQLFLVVAVCMIWRGRRLGRLVPEPLPVVVRAVETTEGRARMYRRSRAHARAAATLREATMGRLRERIGLPRHAPSADVIAVVATRTGRPSADVAAMLVGPPPHDDAGLVRLAQILDQLDREVRHP